MKVDPHDDRNGDRGEDGKGPPRAGKHGIDHGDGKPRQRQNENKHDGDRCDGPRHLADFVFGDLRQALAFMPHRRKENDHVMDRSGQDAPDNDPDGAGQIPELRGKDWAQQRPRRSNGGEMVAEEDILVGLHVIVAVRHLDRGSRFLRVNGQDFLGDIETVKPVSDREYAKGNKDESQGIHFQPPLFPFVDSAALTGNSNEHVFNLLCANRVPRGPP